MSVSPRPNGSSNPFDLSGRTALVTGAGRGLGLGMAAALAQAGAAVVAVARSEPQLSAAVEGLRVDGATATALPWDLADGSDADALVAAAEAEVGPVDILVHAAGNQHRGPALDVDLDDWDRIHDLHLRAAFALARSVTRPALDRGSAASLVFVGSLTSQLGLPDRAPYGAAKTGLLGLMRSLAVEWAPHGIRVNAVLPGYFHTAMTDGLFRDPARTAALRSRIPMDRFGEPADLGGAAVFLASDASRYVTGQAIAVDGGWLSG